MPSAARSRTRTIRSGISLRRPISSATPHAIHTIPKTACQIGNYKLITTTDALGGKVTNTYDTLRNLASATDQLGNTTRYTYDSENRLSGTTDPLAKATGYAYDSNGNRTD